MRRIMMSIGCGLVMCTTSLVAAQEKQAPAQKPAQAPAQKVAPVQGPAQKLHPVQKADAGPHQKAAMQKPAQKPTQSPVQKNERERRFR